MKNLDRIDISIINSLMQDGRKSFRQIAKETMVTTPTVESRFRRLKENGIIKNVEPVFDVNKIQDQMSALVYLTVNPLMLVEVINTIQSLSEVKSAYTTTGNYNMVVRIIAESIEDLETIVREQISSIDGITSVSFQIITRTIKDDHRIGFKDGLLLKMRCVYCYNEIRNSKSIKTGNPEKYFCCNSCLTLYKQKYRGSLDMIPK
ncbi:MAG: Lrp/AsnC ligand binding domain-containing protein [Nitrososphaeraceae archaeon]